MTKLGLIGLGIMGRPIGRNLIAAGHDLTVWNRSKPGIDELVSAGARAASSPKDVAARSEVVITIVGDAPDVDEVALGAGGIVEGAHPRLVVIDMTTHSPDAARRISARLADAAIDMLDAPVSGGETGAINGTLSIMVGGDEAVFEYARPILESIGKTLVYCGPSGSGQVVKLCNQVAVSVTNLAVCEALVLCVKSGVDPRRMLEAVGAGAGSSWQLQNLAPKMLDRDFRAGFKVEHQQKDLRHALASAADVELPLPATALVSQLFAAVEAEGLGGEGTQALVKALEKLGHVRVAG